MSAHHVELMAYTVAPPSSSMAPPLVPCTRGRPQETQWLFCSQYALPGALLPGSGKQEGSLDAGQVGTTVDSLD